MALGASLLLGACEVGSIPTDPSEGALDLPPASAPSSSAPLASAPPASPAAAIVPPLPVQPCCRELPLPAGRYGLPAWLRLDLRIEPAEGWGLINEAKAKYLAFGRGQNSVGTMDRLVALMGTPEGTTDDEVVEHLEAMQTIRYDGPPTLTDVAGFEADELIGTALPNPDEAGDPAADIPAGVVDLDALEAFVSPGLRLTTSTPEARVRIQIIEVGEEVLVAFAEAPPTEADAFFAEVDALLGTIAMPG